jgi:hypothetical protein
MIRAHRTALMRARVDKLWRSPRHSSELLKQGTSAASEGRLQLNRTRAAIYLRLRII